MQHDDGDDDRNPEDIPIGKSSAHHDDDDDDYDDHDHGQLIVEREWDDNDDGGDDAYDDIGPPCQRIMSPWQKPVSQPEARLVVALVELKCWDELNLSR